jgi:hypothetical protein
MIFQWIPKTIKDSRFGKVKLDYSEDGWFADVCGYVEDSGRDYKIQLSSPSELLVREDEMTKDGRWSNQLWFCSVLSAKADGEDPFETEEEVEDCSFHVKQLIEGMFRLCRSMPLKETHHGI